VSLRLLFADELKGFSRSRVMLVLWVGMPVLALLLHTLQPNLEGQMSLTVFSLLVVSTMASTIAAAMLSVGIIHERTRGVYTLFLVRPVRRRSILLGKFLAVFTCVAVASLVTLAAGFLFDSLRGGAPDAAMLRELGKSAATAFASIAIASSAAVLIGVLAPSVVVGVILVIYGANQLSALGYAPVLLNLQPAWLYAVAIGIVSSILLLALSVIIFDRKQL
jgi:ABC-type transport system involved in multi-copper enzyme maturation permease subunit